MSGDRVSERKNTAHRYRQFLPFVQLCKLCQLVLIYVNNEIIGLHVVLLASCTLGRTTDETMMPLALAARTTDPDLGRQPYRSRCRPRCLIRLGVAIWYQSPDLRLARARNREHIDVFHDNNVRRPRLVHSRCTHASPSLKAVSDGWSRLITPGICDWRNRIQGSVCAAAILAAYVRFGSKADITL